MTFRQCLWFLSKQIITGQKTHFFIEKNKLAQPFTTAAQENLGYKIPMDEDTIIFVLSRKSLEEYIQKEKLIKIKKKESLDA